MTVIDIKQAERLLGGKIYGRNRILCPGPGHSRNDRSMSVMFTDSGFVVKSFSTDDWKECRDYVKSVLGLSDDRPVSFREPVPFIDPDRLRKKRTAQEIWERSIPITGTLAETYLASRGLSYSGDALRFNRAGRSMVALRTDAESGDPIGIHQTFLDGNGRAVVMPDGRKKKMMLGQADDGCVGVVRLSGDDEVMSGLGIAEGIETALAAPFRPIWACLSAGSMKAFPVLPGVDALSIFADQDRAGLDAANTCGERWHAAGAEVIMAAPLKGDFADLREAA